MNIPFVDLTPLYLEHRDEIHDALARVLDSQRFIMGPEVLAFEREMAAYLSPTESAGSQAGEATTASVACMGTSSGTCSLLLSLMALDVGPNDEVIVPAYSFIATASTVRLCGARPVFVDVTPDSLNLDCEQVAEQLTEKTRAIIPVHLFGRPADMEALRNVLDSSGREDIAIIEDAAQALGASLSGRRLGTLSEFGCFSFFPSKNLGGFGDGGLVATPDPSLAERVRILRTHGGKDRYYNTRIGINGRLDALQAAILRTRLAHLDDWIAQRRQNAARYRLLFDQAGLLSQVQLPPDDGDGRFFHTYNSFNLRVPGGRRDALRAALEEHHIGTAVYYPTPLPHQPCFASLGNRWGQFPVAEQASAEILAIPIYPGLSVEAQEYVVHHIARFFGLR
ncbi:MAG: DegT/DnrJ/EryC1/StrS family aminotransferase [Bradymonadales bacterium]|nr:DegT/DnrJ/EryC1/StrS family aminotransferase [Bradymonadales bacterium]